MWVAGRWIRRSLTTLEPERTLAVVIAALTSGCVLLLYLAMTRFQRGKLILS